MVQRISAKLTLEESLKFETGYTSIPRLHEEKPLQMSMQTSTTPVATSDE